MSDDEDGGNIENGMYDEDGRDGENSGNGIYSKDG